jgi:hypothetical protein
MKIRLGIILAAACLAVAGCGGSEETDFVVPAEQPGVGGDDAPVAPRAEGGDDEVTVAPEEGSDPVVESAPPPALPEGAVPAAAFRPDYRRFLGGLFEAPPPSSEEEATLSPGGTIVMPAPTREYRLTAIEWIDLTGGVDTGGKSKVLGCYDKAEHHAGVLAGFIHQYSGEGNILGMRGICEDVSEGGRVERAGGIEGIVDALVASVTDIAGSGEPYYLRRCDANEAGVGISQQRLTATSERIEKLDMYCSTGEAGPRFDASNHTGTASPAAVAACTDGKFLFGVVVRYDWRGIRKIDAIGCAKPGWVPVN